VKHSCVKWLLSFLIVLGTANPAIASMKPTHALLYGWSDIVLVGKIYRVSTAKEASTVYIDVSKFVRATYEVRKLKHLSFLYARKDDTRSLDFLKLKQEGNEYLIFLRYEPDTSASPNKATEFRLQLTDSWFGIEVAEPGVVNQLSEFEQKLFGFVEIEPTPATETAQ